MKVNLFSENELIFNKGHGIHSSFINQFNALKRKIKVIKNSIFEEEAELIHLHSFGPLAFFKALTSKKPVIITCHTLPEEVKGSSVLAWSLSKLFPNTFHYFLMHVI